MSMGCDRGVGRVVVPILLMKKQRLGETDYLAWSQADDWPVPQSFTLSSPWIPKGPGCPLGTHLTLSGPPGPWPSPGSRGRHRLPAGESGSGSGRRARGPRGPSPEQPGPHPHPRRALGCPPPRLSHPRRADHVLTGEDLLFGQPVGRAPGPQRAPPHGRR